ncbi:hypothetical protein BCT61_11570 [Vibrio breoganii]|uniref:hypothetical protein n=1 Tax=Vibrio breoganii TaxID=553239 RepID=UPI000C8309DF|nr:hypothetical protein [Vibrio breoganii]PMG08057.1 hypothetical protein BCV00_00690 [Vibrio breoganii]PMK26249.1 hypothetical protein BCU03_03185 [Vibrio breoganii]PMM09132.1 hypothetical protein BCT61_11570 [Vibrio breoganii]
MKKLLLASSIGGAVASVALLAAMGTATALYSPTSFAGGYCNEGRDDCDSSKLTVELEGTLPCICRFYVGDMRRRNVDLGTITLFDLERNSFSPQGYSGSDISVQSDSDKKINFYCNADSVDYSLTSENGGLEHSSGDLIVYEVGLSGFMGGSKISSQALAGAGQVGTLNDAQNIAFTESQLEFSVAAGQLSGKKAGTYTDTLTLEVTGVILGGGS